MDALAAFRPLIARIVYDKATGESRGFAFVEFPSIGDARQVVLAYTHGPLFLDSRPLAIGFTDNNRPSRWSGGDGDRLPPLPGGPLRLDWICAECNGTNFARRSVCFKCEAPRSEQAREVSPSHSGMFLNHMGGGGGSPPAAAVVTGGVPSASSGQRHYENEQEAPTQVLLVRDLPEDIEEGELHIAFAEFEGVNDIRLIRDRVTNQTRGFGFVEFVDAESATAALNSCGSLRVQDQQVRVSYARDTRFSKQHAKTSHHQHQHGGAHVATTANSIAAAALEQAQWSLASGYGGSAQQEGRWNSSLDADVDAFLESAVAAVGASYVERPKKQWPQPFETGGGSYVFASDCGLYYDPDSMFYYDTQSKLYYNSYRGSYYQCLDGANGVYATFSPFVPPVPTDDSHFTGASDPAAAVKKPSGSRAAAGGAVGGFSLTMNKKDKKKPIAIHIKTATTAGSSKVKEAFANSSTSPAGAGAVTSGTSASMKRKSAEDIAKWSQLQRASKANAGEAAASETSNRDAAKPSSSPPATIPRKPISMEAESLKSAQKTELDNLVNAVAVEAPICLLCRRKFASTDLLRKHETLSKLHMENLAKAKANKEVIAAQYRDMEHERNDRKRQRVPSHPPATAAQQPAGSGPAPQVLAPASQQSKEPTPSASSSLESGIGGKMLKMMGWKSGEGLGKHGTGITKPVAAAVGNLGNETAGLGARTANPPPIDLSDMASYKERLQQMARARYDSNTRGL